MRTGVPQISDGASDGPDRGRRERTRPKPDSGDGRSVTRKQAYALLCDKFRYPFSAIATFTDEQIADILFHPRDDKGMLDFSSSLLPGPPMSDREICYTIWLGREPFLTLDDLKARYKAKYGR